MADDAPFLPGLSPFAGKPVHVAFDGGRLTSDAGVLVLAEIDRKLGLAEQLARCIEDRRAPERVRHGLAEMIRYRMLLVAAGYPDGNDCDALRNDPAGTVRNFVYGPRVDHLFQAARRRSSKRMANCDLAMAHSLVGILHSFSARFKTRKSSFMALSSFGKWPRVRTARRRLLFRASMAFVV